MTYDINMFVWVVLLSILGHGIAEIPTINCVLGKMDFRNCLEKEAVTFIPRLLANGVPDFNIPSFDPINIPTTDLRFDGVLITGSVEIRDSILKGLRKTRVERFKVAVYNPPRYEQYVVETTHTRLVVKGKCGGNVTVKGFKLGGTEGEFQATMTNVYVISTVDARHEIKNGSAHLHIDNFKIDLDMENFKIDYLNNMFLNNTLGKHVLGFSNQLWRIFFDGAFPYIAPKIEKIIKEKINAISDVISIDRVLVG